MRAARRQTTAHALLPQHTAALLRRRVAQELEVLRDGLRAVPQGALRADAHVVRRLTRREWAGLAGGGGALAVPGAAAVVVLPPVPKNMLRPGRAPQVKDVDGDGDRALCTLCEDASREYVTTRARKIPIYHGAVVWPDAAERDAVRLLFKEIVGLERRARYKAALASKSPQTGSPASTSADGDTSGRVDEAGAGPRSKKKKVERAKGLDKASDAYLLRSTRDTVVRADTVPLCIALWRLRIWFGQGWGRAMWGGWEKPARRREETKEHLQGKEGLSSSVARDASL